ncbi:hypothetical protein DICA3_F36070 [Diutina catenulata]
MSEAPEGKQRKPQSAEEFLAQKRDFWEKGPTINTDGWLYPQDLSSWDLDLSHKPNRNRLISACEQAYYKRDYAQCLAIAGRGKEMFANVDEDPKRICKQVAELDMYADKSREKLRAQVTAHHT